MRKKQNDNYIMLNKSLKFEDKKEEEEKKINDYCYELIILFIFSILLLLSWFSFKWLYEYQYIFTIYRYINLGFSIYFPIQISSLFLYVFNFILIIIISIICNYFIVKIIMTIINKENNELFSQLPRIIFIPILINSFLFSIGKIIYKNYSTSHFFYYISLCLDLISLFSLIIINLNKIKKDYYFQIDFNNNFVKDIFEGYFFEILLALDLYYCFYVTCQIIYYYCGNLRIENYLGINANLFLGIVSIYIIYELKNNFFTILMGIIFGGILHFQFTIRPQEREEINLGDGEKLLSGIFLFCFLIEFLYIIFYKYQKDYI